MGAATPAGHVPARGGELSFRESADSIGEGGFPQKGESRLGTAGYDTERSGGIGAGRRPRGGIEPRRRVELR